MKLASCLKDYVHVATPVVLALLLLAAFPSAALATSHDEPPPVGEDPPPPPEPAPPPLPLQPPVPGGETPPPPPSHGGSQQPSNGGSQQPSNGGSQQPSNGGSQQPSNGGSQQPSNGGSQQPSDQTMAPHPSAPSTPSSNCFVSHAATPAQLCPIADGLQYYFIGADGSSRTGPHLPSISDLAALHPSGASVSLYTGTNSLTNKPVQIHYLPAQRRIRVMTFYPDTQYDTNKPYNFVLDEDNSVIHEAW